jgi:hypothetical protein
MNLSPRCIVALPVDGRPAVCSQVQMLAEAAGWTLKMPPVAMLGHLCKPADRLLLAEWLEENASAAAGFIISVDMLVYGGLVPSRRITDTLEQLEEKLATLPLLKLKNPEKPIYVFAATMRISNNNVNEEEKTYWAEFGELIWRWSYFSDKFSVTGNQKDFLLAQIAEDAIPAHIRSDYLATRARNFALTRKLLKMVSDGVLERLILPQDDTADFGFNISERRALEAEVAAQGLGSRVHIYPGADEVMHTLCAHLVSAMAGKPSLTFYLHCSDPHNIAGLRALYEDRPILESIACQLDAVGGRLVDDPQAADIILAVHTQGRRQGDWAMQKPLPQVMPLAAGWVDSLRAFQRAGKPVALVDLAYANGADPVMLAGLQPVLPLYKLAAYAGWNTASNSIGSLIAQCVLAHGDYETPANKRIVALRLLEDCMYQAVLRQTLRSQINEAELSPQQLAAKATDTVIQSANEWAELSQLEWRISSIALPWDRSFEIDLQLQQYSPHRSEHDTHTD